MILSEEKPAKLNLPTCDLLVKTPFPIINPNSQDLNHEKFHVLHL